MLYSRSRHVNATTTHQIKKLIQSNINYNVPEIWRQIRENQINGYENLTFNKLTIGGPTDDENQSWTTFLMDLREPRVVPTSIDIRNVEISVKILRVPTNIITDDQTEGTDSISIRTINGNLDINVSKRFSQEMERVTKKKPPTSTKIFPEFIIHLGIIVVIESLKIYFHRASGFKSDDKGTGHARQCLEERAAHALTRVKQELSILSTNGVLPISSIRIPDPGIAGIIKQVPVVPNIVLERCITFFDKARARNLIRGLAFQDVLLELKSRILSEDEMVNLLKWWIFYCSKGNHNVSEKIDFMQFAKMRIGDISQALEAFDHYLNPGIIPPDIDLPVEVLPYSISRKLQRKDLDKCFRLSE
ncbi:12631_t:CDS:2 [Funneliformis geosporum]|nr:12631_t:CDS:2 [Funneliformis geosporum]